MTVPTGAQRIEALIRLAPELGEYLALAHKPTCVYFGAYVRCDCGFEPALQKAETLFEVAYTPDGRD